MAATLLPVLSVVLFMVRFLSRRRFIATIDHAVEESRERANDKNGREHRGLAHAVDEPRTP
jgi:hypothetical protein